MCIPLLMTEELLQDLVLYKKEKEKAVSSVARSLMSLFREICPSLLIKKDRGRPVDPKARPKAFGEVNVASNVSGIELLQDTCDDSDDDFADDDVDEDGEGIAIENEMEDFASSDDENIDLNADSDSSQSGDELVSDEDEQCDEDGISSADDGSASDFNVNDDEDEGMNFHESQDTNSKKRKVSDFDGQLNAADKSLRALKKLASAKIGNDELDLKDGILSNEELKRIRELKAKAEARAALSHHGLLKKGSDSKSPLKILNRL